jgi:proline iminopeptidase
MKWKKILLVSVAGVVIAAVAIGGLFWYWMEQPMYTPGMVRGGQNLRAPLAPAKSSADGRFWQVEPDIELYHFTGGSGRNVLVVHGGPGLPYTAPWPGLEPLTQSYRFHYYDQRGCGQSTRPFDRFTSSNYYENLTTLERTLGLGAHIADIERIRQALGEERLILIGHSWGGFLTSLYAAEFPERVQALVLVAPADMLVMPSPEGGLFEEVRKRLPANLQTEYAAYLNEYLSFQDIFSKGESSLVELNARFGKYYAAAVKTAIPEQGQPGGWMVQAQYFSLGKRHDYREALKKVTAPVLVIHGADDLQTEKASRAYADAFPNSRFQMIQGAAHFSYSDQPQQFATIVGEFMASNR